MGFWGKLFGNDASFLGVMDFTGELDDAPQEEVEVTFTIECEEEDTPKKAPPNRKKHRNPLRLQCFWYARAELRTYI